MVHLVYCDNTGKKGEKVLDKILSGTKTMIIRGAAGRKIPHSRVFKGEELYFMEKGSLMITAKAKVRDVQNYVKLTEEEICLVEFEDVEEIAPLPFDHQGNMDDWLIIDKIEDVVVGTSIAYNYEKSKF